MAKPYLVCPKSGGEMGLYQYEIITKTCLINENMTQVSELIYLKKNMLDYSVAKDEGAPPGK